MEKNYIRICKFCFEKTCICRFDKCEICKIEISNWDTNSFIFEYRGILYCKECKKEAIEKRDYERQEIIKDNIAKTKKFAGLDLSDSVIGKANRKILFKQIEIAKKENYRIKKYEEK